MYKSPGFINTKLYFFASSASRRRLRDDTFNFHYVHPSSVVFYHSALPKDMQGIPKEIVTIK